MKARNDMHRGRQVQRTLYRKAKQDKGGKFYSLDDKLWREEVLWEAWRQVKAHRGAPGVDGASIEAMVSSGQAGELISRRSRELRAQTYRFHPVRRGDIPKPKGGPRPLGMATGEDRVGQTAMKLVLEPIFAADFHDCSYGYRPKREAKQASLAIRADLYEGAWGVGEIEFQSYFTTIPHDKLLRLIRQRVVEGSMLRLIKQSRKVGVAYQGRIEATTIGVPQGSPISPLYSNSSVNLLEQLWHSRGYPETLGATLHRYADDAILVCRQDARQAREAFEAISRRMGWVVKRDKTRLTQLTEGVDFIGFEVVKRRRPTRGTWILYILPSTACQRQLRPRMKFFTTRRAPLAPEACGQRVHQTVRGWANYYRHINASHACRSVQRFINPRFRRSLTHRSKGRGFGWRKYPNTVLYAKGISHMGSGSIRYERAPVHAL